MAEGRRWQGTPPETQDGVLATSAGAGQFAQLQQQQGEQGAGGGAQHRQQQAAEQEEGTRIAASCSSQCRDQVRWKGWRLVQHQAAGTIGVEGT